ncbi:hypothetical protein BCT94_05620 [Vibrio breoganii]|nr:hypothetical protein BCU03_06945 [Vibrio breoganii]PMK78564.1 hypothetical protein BCT94_05620 [Vibrio breoganii]
MNLRFLVIPMLILVSVVAVSFPFVQLQYTEIPSIFENADLFKKLMGEYLSLQISGLLIALMCFHLLRASLLDS